MSHLRLAWLGVAACAYSPATPGGGNEHDAPAPIDATVTADAPPSLACATNPAYVPHTTGIRYRAVTTAATWTDARDACILDDARLVIVEDINENAHVDSLLTTEIWIGLSDLVTDGTFVWVDDSPLTFENWRLGGNPNGGTTANCVEFDETGGTWNDETCTQTHGYVCECL